MRALERAERVAQAAANLLESGPATTHLTLEMAAASGWSEPMARWILGATLGPLSDAADVAGWAERGGADGGFLGSTVVVAGGPVPDPTVRSLAAAALLGGSVHLKVAAAEPVLAPAFAHALREHGDFDVSVHDLRHGVDLAHERAFYGSADRVLAFGRATSIEALRDLAGDGCLFLGHGPRLSIAVILDPYDDEGLAGLALDIARYDQRGCLSPQAILVAGGDEELARVIEHLGRELEVLTSTIPPGAGSLADEIAWRLRADSVLLDSIARERPDYFHSDGETYAVHACRGGTLELSPGWRIAAVLATDDPRTAAPAALGAAREYVQGIALVGADPAGWSGFLGAQRVARAGELQTPPLDFRPDGHDPYARR